MATAKVNRPQPGSKAARQVALAGAAVLLLTAAKPPLPLQATSPWNVHSEDETCKVRRSFGPDTNRVSIEMTRFGPDSEIQLALYGNGLSPIYKGRDYSVAFGDLTAHESTGAMTGTDGNGIKVSILRLSGFAPKLPAGDRNDKEGWKRTSSPEREVINPSTVSSMTIAVAGRSPIVLETGSLGRVYTIWDQCIDQLIASWGFDPALKLSGSAQPLTDPATWLSSRDYPHEALRENKDGVVYFRLVVAEDGLPASCAVQRALNEAEFAAHTCKILLKRAKFAPATDQSGKAVKSLFQSSVRFNIGKP